MWPLTLKFEPLNRTTIKIYSQKCNTSTVDCILIILMKTLKHVLRWTHLMQSIVINQKEVIMDER